jgi:excisionase family DNA binding protein
MEIRENEVYTTEEAQKLLKVSSSTMMRLIKKGIIQAAKLGKQYRIMGKELLRAVSPKLEDKVGIIYNKGRRWLHEDIENEKSKPSQEPVQSAADLVKE